MQNLLRCALSKGSGNAFRLCQGTTVLSKSVYGHRYSSLRPFCTKPDSNPNLVKQSPLPQADQPKIPISEPTAGAEDKPSFVAKTLKLVPGIVAAGAVMSTGFVCADYIGQALLAAQGVTGAKSPISGIPVSIILGLAINNTLPLPKILAPGLKAATVTVLRAGIVCVGIKLSALDLVTMGLTGIPVIAVSIASGITFIRWFGGYMGLPSRMSSLIAAGTSICGVTAITALAPAIGANQKEVAFAVANVVAFGTLGMLCYPYVAQYLFASSQQIGMFLGIAIHDTSQVIGSALTYKEVFGDEMVLKMAAITKLTRNLFLAGVIPTLAWLNARDQGSPENVKMGVVQSILKYLPSFVVGFILMAILRTIGDMTMANTGCAFGLIDADSWKAIPGLVGDKLGTQCFLGTAMAAVGLSTSMSALSGVGVRPFIVGLSGSCVVGSTAFVMITLMAILMEDEVPKGAGKEDVAKPTK